MEITLGYFYGFTLTDSMPHACDKTNWSSSFLWNRPNRFLVDPHNFYFIVFGSMDIHTLQLLMEGLESKMGFVP